MPKLNGANFVAQAEISIATEKGLVIVAKAGESCEKVPAWDLERLAARGKITPLESPSPKKRGKE